MRMRKCHKSALRGTEIYPAGFSPSDQGVEIFLKKEAIQRGYLYGR